jgi:uncharacterized phage infection (PIP) family protein YhgE
MTPRQASASLLKIASKIENSMSPSKSLVLHDLHTILASIEYSSERSKKNWEQVDEAFSKVQERYESLTKNVKDRKDENTQVEATKIRNLMEKIEDVMDDEIRHQIWPDGGGPPGSRKPIFWM